LKTKKVLLYKNVYSLFIFLQSQDVKPMGYSLQEKSALEKSQFIKARMGLSAEVE
jgi:hypothetical protein